VLEKLLSGRNKSTANQGCQIFLGTANQNGKKCTKIASKVPGVDVIYDHNFLRFLPIFGGNICVFHKKQCYD
jgi:hypothetical protein